MIGEVAGFYRDNVILLERALRLIHMMVQSGSYDYNPDRPAMWRLLKSVSKAARAAGRPLSICGELAGDPRFTAQLIETGIDTISVSARRISGVRRMARNLLSTSASPDPGCPVAVEPN